MGIPLRMNALEAFYYKLQFEKWEISFVWMFMILTNVTEILKFISSYIPMGLKKNDIFLFFLGFLTYLIWIIAFYDIIILVILIFFGIALLGITFLLCILL